MHSSIGIALVKISQYAIVSPKSNLCPVTYTNNNVPKIKNNVFVSLILVFSVSIVKFLSSGFLPT